jgi:very-short-patch-repair endonuclease
MATAVAAGKGVLFVAEKRAALDVVKRRLDEVGVGDVCLELHSNKANKRVVLAELERVFRLGRPAAAPIEELAAALQERRDRLNHHCRLLHSRLTPSGATPYEIIGRLVQFRHRGVKPPDFEVPAGREWTEAQLQGCVALVGDLSSRVEEMGTPDHHPWRGAGVESLLPNDVTRIAVKATTLVSRMSRLLPSLLGLRAILGREGEDHANSARALAAAALWVADAPTAIDGRALTSTTWENAREAIAELVANGKKLVSARASLQGRVAEAAWVADIAPIRLELVASGRSWLRFLRGSYRHAVRALRSLLIEPLPRPFDERLRIVDTLLAAQISRAHLEKERALGAEAFGSLYRGDGSNWDQLAAVETWERSREKRGVAPTFRTSLSGACERREELRSLANLIIQETNAIETELRDLFGLVKLDLGAAFEKTNLEEIEFGALCHCLDEWTAAPERAVEWIRYRIRSDEARRLRLDPLVERLYDGRLAPGAAVETLEMAYFELLFRDAVAEHPELAQFDGRQHQALVDEFRRLDLERIALARAEVALGHFRGMPNASQSLGQVAVLRHEFAKRRRHLPIRQLLRRAGLAAQALTPVFMMSPLSVAQFLEPGSVSFDLLLIDEASQVLPVDALGAIARCRQLVVVGDKKQLPPTHFFLKLAGEDQSIALAEDDLEAGDVESILELCEAQGAPQVLLRWHYRSQHQSLIAVSNHEFYQDRLFIIPSAHVEDPERGLRFRYLANGVFDRAASATNRVEAAAVAAAVMEHARTRHDLTLGVGTFSAQQRDAILDELEHRRRATPATEEFFVTDNAEPFFVKNLEAIQGDERDVIFISVGYGKDKSGFFSMNFGPLSSDGGERRLNVLITRARRRCEVFSSIRANEIDLERARGRGPAALKSFLQYAETRILGVGMPSGKDFGSPFEEAVAKELVRLGFEVEPQVGAAGFFIDLAVRDPGSPGRYLLGIECDGAGYHSARSARDRDRLRQQVLEDHGWSIHRIWSIDWFHRPEDELRKVVAAIESARMKRAGRAESPSPAVAEQTARADASMSILRETADDEDSGVLVEPYREAAFSVARGDEPHKVSPVKMADIVSRIVEIEGPIHEEEIARRVTTLWGLQRTGNRIGGAVRQGLKIAARRGSVIADGDFYRTDSNSTPMLRDRSGVDSATLRRPDMIPPSEIRYAIQCLVASHIGITSSEVVNRVSRLLGFKATSAQLRSTIEREIELLIQSGQLSEATDGFGGLSSRMLH